MTVDFDSVRCDLKKLPASTKLDQAQALLDEIESIDKKQVESLRKFEESAAKNALSPSEARFFRLLPLLTSILAIFAICTGWNAIVDSKYCSSGRGVISCSHGLRAQLEGVATISVGLLIAIIPITSNRKKIVALWLLGVIGVVALFASILVGSNTAN